MNKQSLARHMGIFTEFGVLYARYRLVNSDFIDIQLQILLIFVKKNVSLIYLIYYLFQKVKILIKSSFPLPSPSANSKREVYSEMVWSTN
jgi:hypothetical protein